MDRPAGMGVSGRHPRQQRLFELVLTNSTALGCHLMVLDLTDAHVREKSGVSLKEITGNSHDVTHGLGDWASENWYKGILAPSARNASGAKLIASGGL